MAGNFNFEDIDKEIGDHLATIKDGIEKGMQQLKSASPEQKAEMKAMIKNNPIMMARANKAKIDLDSWL